MCFVVLARLGTWTPFAFVGLLLVAFAVRSSAVQSAQFRASTRSLSIGVGSGLLMVLVTHLGYGWLSAALPAVRTGTLELLSLLNVVGFSPLACAALIVVIASCEEVVFRGLLPSSTRDQKQTLLRAATPEFVRPVLWAAAYALTTVPLGSPLLVACAFACGSAWGMLRIATGSILVPLLTHVIWDLGVLLVWPLPS